MATAIPKSLISKEVDKGTTYTKVKVTCTFTGNINFSITANGDAGTPTWNTIPLVSGTESSETTFTVSGDSVKYRIIGSSGAVVSKPLKLELS